MEHSYLTEVNANFCCRVRCCYYNHDSPLTHFLGYNHEFGTSSSFRCISIVLGIVRFEHNVKLHTGVVHGGKQRRSEGPTRLFKPEGEVKDDNLAIVLVHPYSVLGGSQGLLKGIASCLAQNGYAAVTFDMRGVGSSTGVKDVVAISNWLSSTLSLHRILLVGSSAGAPIAGSAVDQIEQVIGYVSIGYPFGMTSSILFGRHHKAILQSPKPKLFIMGTRDGFTSVKQLKNKLSSAAGRVETHLVDGVGHFQMEGPAYDSHMVDLIIEFIASL